MIARLADGGGYMLGIAIWELTSGGHAVPVDRLIAFGAAPVILHVAVRAWKRRAARREQGEAR